MCASAQYCVRNRLRTHFGNAGATFTAFDRLLQQRLQRTVNAVGPKTPATMMRTSSGSTAALVSESATPHGSVVVVPSLKSRGSTRLLLEFMEALEKCLYVAYEGSMLAGSAPSPAATSSLAIGEYIANIYYENQL